MTTTLINVLAFYLGWFACILGAGRGYPFIGPLVVTILLGVHFSLTPDVTREVSLILLVGVLGSSLDTGLMLSGVYSFPGHSLSWLCPLWITALWLNFATTFNTSLSWLRRRYTLAAVLGAVAGPLSYYAGARLGALRLNLDSTLTLLILAAIWGVLLPGLLRLAVFVPQRRAG